MLKGDASDLVRDFELSDSSYSEAWSHVLHRYENRRAVIKTYFADLLALQPIKSEHDIRLLLDKTNGIIRGLKVCGENTDAMS